jgi:Zn-dependent protease with chaperone function
MAAGAALAVAVARDRPASPGPATARRGESIREEAAALTPRVTPEMVRYSYTRYALYFVGVALDLAILVLFLRTGASARWRDKVERRIGRPVVRTLVYFIGFSLAYSALTLPLTFYSGWWIPHQYHLSDQSPPAWAWDRVKEAMIGFAITAPLVLALYALIRRQPRRWWFSFWLLSIPVTIFLVLIAPVVLDPVFHKYEPLRNQELRDKILTLAAKAGIQGGRVYEVDMSRETKTVNAYVTGLGATKRIVLWDTTLQRLKPDEILFIMGHEMGHYVYNHVYWGLGLSIGGSFVLFFLLDGATRLMLARWGAAWGVTGLGDLAALPALMATLALLQFFGTPIMGAVSRTMEAQADRFGLRITGNGHAAARAFVKLSEDNLSLPSPPPAIHYWLGTHPTLQERIDNALEWDREHRTGRQEAAVNGEEGAPDRAG